MKYKIPLLFVLVVVIITMHKAHGKKSTDTLGINRKLPNIYENMGGDFKLTGPEGNEISSVSFRGKIILIYFGYTYCPDFCPMTLSYLNAVMIEIAELAKDVQVLFITIDPERDTPEYLKEYVAYFHPKTIGLSGSLEQIKAIARAYRIYFAKAKEDDGASDEYLLDHSSITYLMGKDGKYLAHFSIGTSAEEIARRIRKYL